MQEEQLEKWQSHNKKRELIQCCPLKLVFLKASLFFLSQVIFKSIFSIGNFEIFSESLKIVIETHCYNAYRELTCVLFPFLPSSFTGTALTQKRRAKLFLFQKCTSYNNRIQQ